MGGALWSPNYGAPTQPHPTPTKPNATQQKQCVSMPVRSGAPTQPNSNPTQQRQYVGISRWWECVRHGLGPKVFDMNLTKSKKIKRQEKPDAWKKNNPGPTEESLSCPPIGLVRKTCPHRPQAIKRAKNVQVFP